ncbi:MAG: DUF1622 domain-containing protein [Acidimicrobiia bacterium]
MTFEDAMELVGKALDAIGVAVIVGGLAIATGASLARARQVETRELYRRVRHGIGRAILLGLEILVAADIIRTVAVNPTFSSAGVLAIIVAIRTFLSFSLEVELEGRWPWQAQPSQGASSDRRRHS